MIILEYLKVFMRESNWLDEKVPEQARAIFTTWCFMKNIQADTAECDDALLMLHNENDIEDLDISYDEFENFMIEFII